MMQRQSFGAPKLRDISVGLYLVDIKGEMSIFLGDISTVEVAILSGCQWRN